MLNNRTAENLTNLFLYSIYIVFVMYNLLRKWAAGRQDNVESLQRIKNTIYLVHTVYSLIFTVNKL